MPKLTTAIGTLLTIALLAACSSNGADAPTSTPHSSTTPTRTSEGPLNGLTQFNAANPLLVEGRDTFRMCVEVVDTDLSDVGTEEEEFVQLFGEALNDATTDPRWRSGFGSPEVSVGCPLPPVALDTSKGTFADRSVCQPEVSEFLIFAFIGTQERFEERFSSELVALEGIRRSAQEYISSPESSCYRQVTEAWYLTPDDVRRPELLMDYIFGIFHIADLGR